MTTMTKGEVMTRERLNELEAAHARARQVAGELRSRLTPSTDGRRDPTRREILEAKQQLEQAERDEVTTALAWDDAKLAYDAEQRRRRQAVIGRCDPEAQAELATLIRETDRVAAAWATLAERNRARDVEYLGTSGLTEFGMTRYADQIFPPLAALPGEPSMWMDFKARVEGRGH
jgi:hypothetical protein